MLSRRAFDRSPEQVDPLSWFSGPVIPIVFGVIAVAWGLLATAVEWPHTAEPSFQALALVVIALPFLLVTRQTRPQRRALSGSTAMLAVVLGWLAVAASAVGYVGGGLPVEDWWAPVALSLVLGACAPYTSAPTIGLLGLASTVVTGAITAFAFGSAASIWPEVSRVVIALSPVAVGAVASTVFSAVTVDRILRWMDHAVDASDAPAAADVQLRRSDLAALDDRVIPLLRRVAESGRITTRDRALARIQAREIRDDLVRRANRSWLHQVADSGELEIVDPEQRAESMRQSQRAALRGLVLALLDLDERGADPVRVELRGELDGSTAVAVRVPLDLPEGRRVTALAPYYLTLGQTVQDLRWEAGEELGVRFAVK